MVELVAAGAEGEAGVDVRAVLDAFRAIALRMPRWEVETTACIGFFSFTKYLMWLDLAARDDAGGEVEDIRRPVPPRPAESERVGAEQRPGAAAQGEVLELEHGGGERTFRRIGHLISVAAQRAGCDAARPGLCGRAGDCAQAAGARIPERGAGDHQRPPDRR